MIQKNYRSAKLCTIWCHPPDASAGSNFRHHYRTKKTVFNWNKRRQIRGLPDVLGCSTAVRRPDGTRLRERGWINFALRWKSDPRSHAQTYPYIVCVFYTSTNLSQCWYNVYPKFMSTYTIFREPGIRAITQTGVAAVDVALLTTVGGGVSIAGDVRGQ